MQVSSFMFISEAARINYFVINSRLMQYKHILLNEYVLRKI